VIQEADRVNSHTPHIAERKDVARTASLGEVRSRFGNINNVHSALYVHRITSIPINRV
jgi:hypothetical protein